MGRKKKYRNAAEKQKAWRLRHGQKVKVSLVLRRGERTGSRDYLRERKEGESWEDYHNYIQTVIKATRGSEGKGRATKEKGEEVDKGVTQRRAYASYKEPTLDEGYYERQREHEISLEKAAKPVRGKMKAKRRKTKK